MQRISKRSRAKRTVKFGGELYIERDDFMEEPPKKYFRLKPGGAQFIYNLD